MAKPKILIIITVIENADLIPLPVSRASPALACKAQLFQAIASARLLGLYDNGFGNYEGGRAVVVMLSG